MGAHSPAPNGLVAVHIAVVDPAGVPVLSPEAPQVSDYLRQRWAAAEKYADIRWRELGAEPRWLGQDTSNCAAAINPSQFHNNGADELARFLAGAAARDETALIIATLGNTAADTPRSPLNTFDASITFPGFAGSIAGKLLPTHTPVTLAPDLDPADRDLGLRLRNRPADAPWWAMTLRPMAMEGSYGVTVHEPVGDLVPILVDSLGAPVVARWTPAEGQQLWYVIPDGTDWNVVVDWLVQRALPTHVPAALPRVRSAHGIDPALETAAETEARTALADLDQRYAADKARLEGELQQAREIAEPMRNALLYGTGTELENAVADVLRAAGLTVTELDTALGDTVSADLLAIMGDQACLVEVKSASGAASENLAGQLKRHLDTWPQLRPEQPLTCAALVVNHQHRLDPAQRTPTVYRRQAFLEALAFPVIPTRELFEWWRTADWAALRQAVFPTAPHPEPISPPQSTDRDPNGGGPDQGPRGGWRSRFGRTRKAC